MSVHNHNFKKMVIIYFTPFLGSLIRNIASDLGYGSTQGFYFIISDFELYSFSLTLLILLVSIMLFIVNLGLIKEKKWNSKLNKSIWYFLLLIFPIGTLFGIYMLWMINREEKIW